MFVGKLRKIEIGYQLVFDVIYGILQCIYELFKVLFVNEHLTFLVNKITIALKTPTFCDGQIVVVGTGGTDIKKVGTLTRPDPLGVNPVSVFSLHNSWF